MTVTRATCADTVSNAAVDPRPTTTEMSTEAPIPATTPASSTATARPWSPRSVSVPCRRDTHVSGATAGSSAGGFTGTNHDHVGIRDGGE